MTGPFDKDTLQAVRKRLSKLVGSTPERSLAGSTKTLYEGLIEELNDMEGLPRPLAIVGGEVFGCPWCNKVVTMPDGISAIESTQTLLEQLLVARVIIDDAMRWGRRSQDGKQEWGDKDARTALECLASLARQLSGVEKEGGPE